MRTAFIETLCQLAENDSRIWLVNGDLGFSVLERFATRFPTRYLNAGVAEQNMIGVAAGLALAGKVVFTYSIANFPTFRCLEQIRNDVCYHNLNVKVVAVGGGLSYGSAGYTHHGVEDLAVMGVLPNMTVVAPGDPVETRLATEALAAQPGPAYLRLGKANEPVVHTTDPAFRLGQAIQVRAGEDVALFSTGAMLQTVVTAAEVLAGRGVSARVLSMPTLQPLDETSVVGVARELGRVVTVEEHGPGGLGTLSGEVLARAGVGAAFAAVRLPRQAIWHSGDQEHLRALHGLSPEAIAETAMRVMDRSPPSKRTPAIHPEATGNGCLVASRDGVG
jgi:transketolase